MDLPSVTLCDLGFDCEVDTADQIEPRVFASKSNEILIINSKSVYWYKGNIITRKLIYETEVSNAFLTSHGSTKEEMLVVVLSDCIYFYYKDGRSYISSFAFKIKNALQYQNGIIIEKEPGTNNVQFLTITEPMDPFGSIVSSSTSSISPNESLIYFPLTSESSIAVTYNETENSISLYHTRFLNRSLNNSLTGSSIHRKQSVHNRRTSLANNNITGSYGKDMIDNNDEELRVDRKRSVSHSEMMSVDRMASYDSNSNKFAQTPTTTSGLDPSTLRKDATLTRFEHLKLKGSNLLKHLKVSLISSETKEALIIKNDSNSLFEILIFSKSGSGRFNTPQFTESFNVSDRFVDYTVSSELPGFMIMVSTDNKFVLYDPFNGVNSSIYQPKDLVTKIYNNNTYQLIVKNNLNQIQSYKVISKSKSEAVGKILTSFKLLVSSHTYDYIRLVWFNAFSLVHNDWKALVLTMLVVVLPFSVDPSIINQNNLVSTLLISVDRLQMRALEDNFNLHQMAPNFVLALHLIREEFKLNILQSNLVDDLGLLLAQLTFWMGWGGTWYEYYEIESQNLNSDIRFPTLPILEKPPSIIKSLCSLFESTIVPYCTFSRLTQESEKMDESITPRSFYVLRLFEAIVSAEFSTVDVVNMITEFNITQSKLETYPIGIVIPIKEAISAVEKTLTSLDKDMEKLEFVQREDLRKLGSSDLITSQQPSSRTSQKHQTKDIHQIITSIHDLSEPLAPLETDRFNITKLIFSEDRKFYEISKILQTSQNQIYFTEEFAALPEEDALKKQKEIAALVALRTLSIPLGRSMLFFSSKVPLATERFPDPKLNFNALFQPDNVTVSYERSNINNSVFQWGYFHNGASNGLTISKDSKGISGSWIVFNKPETLTAQHGGFLLGLGLNGHLKLLEEWNIYNYLGPKHFFTSIGLLLGMSASLRGTMDVKLTKVLSVHVVALLPQGASDLIISTQVQAAGLIGIGLLYLETQHRRMSEILLSQINANIIVEEKELGDESYRLSAGIGLGYVNLGKGDDLRGLHDSHAIDQLISIATLVKDVQTEQSLDKSMAGAIIALSFIYLRTNDHVIAKKLEIPENQHLVEYIRPDLLLLRALGKNLILWDKIGKSREWVESQVPDSIMSYLDSQKEIFNSNYYYVISGSCLSVGLKYASSQDVEAKNTIIGYYDSVTKALKSVENSASYSVRLIKQYLSRCQSILAVTLSLIVAGSGDLEVFRRLRILHGELDISNKDEVYGKSMAVSIALGFLFLGGGQYAFNTSSNFAIASLVTSLYPLFPRVENIEPDVHLQALRHFWSLSVEPRCLVVRDVETNKPIKSDVIVELNNGNSEVLQAPCLLPPLDTIKKIVSETEEYFKLEINNMSDFNNKLDLYVLKRKKVEVLKQSVKLIIDKINSNLDEDSITQDDVLVELSLFNKTKKVDVLKLLKDEPDVGFNPNIIDRQIELNHIVESPSNVSELWNLKLIFAFYDRLLTEQDAHYLTLEYVDDLKNKLTLFAKSLNK